MSEKLDISKFDCVYENWGDTRIPSCKTHTSMLVRPGIIMSSYEPEYGLNRPCTLIEAQGIWLFYEWVWDKDGNHLSLYPQQFAFSVKDHPLTRTSNLSLAWVANEKNILKAIEEWEAK